MTRSRMEDVARDLKSSYTKGDGYLTSGISHNLHHNLHHQSHNLHHPTLGFGDVFAVGYPTDTVSQAKWKVKFRINPWTKVK